MLLLLLETINFNISLVRTAPVSVGKQAQHEIYASGETLPEGIFHPGKLGDGKGIGLKRHFNDHFSEEFGFMFTKICHRVEG